MSVSLPMRAAAWEGPVQFNTGLIARAGAATVAAPALVAKYCMEFTVCQPAVSNCNDVHKRLYISFCCVQNWPLMYQLGSEAARYSVYVCLCIQMYLWKLCLHRLKSSLTVSRAGCSTSSQVQHVWHPYQRGRGVEATQDPVQEVQRSWPLPKVSVVFHKCFDYKIEAHRPPSSNQSIHYVASTLSQWKPESEMVCSCNTFFMYVALVWWVLQHKSERGPESKDP